ncbi:Nineteen complex-related protein 2 domain-containing protein [Pleurostoma richardsiae]|uniref:Nineteen complex-related protein 2 domain-containing protein n=1 Tax=Pleurostoma richardsiae TaxID=41990 RepID=A0AA38R2N9_9PEZI|nr:Nineteen complex-related protein 2 domain-containing protein [Pleurostoma richardsiae]
MSTFAAKRKARKIQVAEDDGDLAAPVAVDEEPMTDAPPAPSVKFSRKPFKQSALRKSINFNDVEELGGATASSATSAATEEEESGAPVVIRPAIGRSGSVKTKKRQSTSSRLSFGPSESGAGDDGGEVFTPKKSSLGHRALENNALRRSLSGRLPTRAVGGDDERPRYSKEYLDELQSSTPNTPQNIASLRIDDDEMELDASELEGAVVVPSADLAPATATTARHIPSAAEIREKKERRARLALEQGAYDEDEEDEDGYISLLPKKKDESRLIAEDEDLGEGYDEYVEDGGLSLGKKAEREAQKRHRQEMAELINAAEGGSDEEEDDSEAERRAAYEEAQTRAAMDGLHRPEDNYEDLNGDGRMVVPKMKPLPDLGECLAKMRELVQGMEDQVLAKRKRILALEKEKEEILSREAEVQGVLDKAGAKYQAVLSSNAEAAKAVSQSPLRPQFPGITGDLPVERGLESFGTTPTTRPSLDDA